MPNPAVAYSTTMLNAMLEHCLDSPFDIVVEELDETLRNHAKLALEGLQLPIPNISRVECLTTPQATSGPARAVGAYNKAHQLIWIYVGLDRSPYQIARTFAHEVGHAYDRSTHTSKERQLFCEVLAISPDRAHDSDWGVKGEPWAEQASEVYAECFASYWVGLPNRWLPSLVPQPTDSKLSQLASLGLLGTIN